MSDDNIYDVENYEDVNNIGDDNLNSTLRDNINEDFIDEDKILERNNKFDSNQDNMNNYNKKKKKMVDLKL